MVNEFDTFYKEINRLIESKQRVAYPIMGVITKVSNNREFADVRTEDGVISNIPAHGMPIVGDSVIIHFINGNYEQPVCDCARRFPTPTSELEDYLTNDCFNLLPNGDFRNYEEGYEGDFEILEGESATGTTTRCCKLEEGDSIILECNIKDITTDYFKFQCFYRGLNYLQIECADLDTLKRIPTVPKNVAQEITYWSSDQGRFNWAFNKNVYEKGDIENITIRITNISSDSGTMTLNNEKVPVFSTMLIDGLLIYNENGDTNYYLNSNDINLENGLYQS